MPRACCVKASSVFWDSCWSVQCRPARQGGRHPVVCVGCTRTWSVLYPHCICIVLYLYCICRDRPLLPGNVRLYLEPAQRSFVFSGFSLRRFANIQWLTSKRHSTRRATVAAVSVRRQCRYNCVSSALVARKCTILNIYFPNFSGGNTTPLLQSELWCLSGGKRYRLSELFCVVLCTEAVHSHKHT